MESKSDLDPVVPDLNAEFSALIDYRLWGPIKETTQIQHGRKGRSYAFANKPR